MIIITAVVVMLGVYEIINSIGFRYINNKVLVKEHNRIMNRINNIDDLNERERQIDFYIENDNITRNELDISL